MRGFFATLLLTAGMLPALAHMHDRPELNQWFSELHSRGGGLCCSLSDEESGNLVVVEQYVSAEEFEAHHCKPTLNDAVSVKDPEPPPFCVFIYDQWWLVPARNVLDVPNPYGQAMAWLSFSWSGDRKMVQFFRCFLPASGV